MSERTPEEALAISQQAMVSIYEGKSFLDRDLEEPIDRTDLWPLSVQTSLLSNKGTAMAILGYREHVYRIHDWVKKATDRLITGHIGDFRWMAYDKVLATWWLCEGEPDRAFLLERASGFPKRVPDDVELDIFQAIRLIDADMLTEAREFLDALQPGVPVLVHSAKRLTPATALHLAIDHLEGKPFPEGYPAELRKLLSRLRKSYFPRGHFAAIVPWVRLYNRLFVGERDPWQVMAWLRGDPVKTFPVPTSGGCAP